MKKIVLIALSLLVIGGIGVGAMTVFGVAFNKTEIHKKETVAVEKIDEIEIKTSAADVEIITVDSKDIEVLLDGEISKELVDEYKFDVKKENNRLNIKFSKNQNYVGWGIGTAADVNLQVKVPKKIYDTVKVTTSSGDFVAKEIETKVAEINTSSGDVSLSHSKVNEKLTAKTSSGKIKTDKSEIEVAKLNTRSGKIRVEGLHSKELAANTSSGDIEYNDRSLRGEVECNTSSGDVKMQFDTFPESLRVEFDGSSGKADINVAGLLYEEKSKNQLVGVKGTGENKVKVKTSSGDFKLR
ncbi:MULTISPECIES: DUF4097 family beta strand repeat-containing protein [Bacillus]|uniref:DUF4097 family beta strand repeat-containing protein n=1 Tax=Bacillus TaxID=1386 RepID=UPI0001A14744|nr:MULTISPECIES: DUF4097 family beta strand repeat-containing protein [Bacillus]AIK39873.1 hypothetical protein DJ92_2938 [Bacillus pseudomycoides]AJI16106.1 hypothetical protein BG07_2002 [Bacillus pseudomycoides]EEM18780.1 hypothetical protein bpmyx0001_2490 [Bacillus pseudomycoides DSM 12442]MEB3056361.1 DUF4097 family beta strand repeat-containing protein [Bacillus pseudomycoides]MED1598512.1 DUF4097 family beta strand repeat-containing protein [Bacillus pseudomycoides]